MSGEQSVNIFHAYNSRRARSELYRGFESLPLRHISLKMLIVFDKRSSNPRFNTHKDYRNFRDKAEALITSG